MTLSRTRLRHGNLQLSLRNGTTTFRVILPSTKGTAGCGRRRERPSLQCTHSSFSRHLCAANAVPVQHLVVVHGDGHLDELACEREGALVVRNRRAAIASDIETRPRDKVKEAEPRLDTACRYAINQQREFAETRAGADGRLQLSRETTHTDAELVLTPRYRRRRSYDHMLPSDIHVVHQ